MPAQTASKAADSNFISDYLADWDDEPSRSPSPKPAKKDDKGRKEKSKTDVLGIEQQIDVKKKPRVPRVKLDEARLLSDKGIPKLRRTAPRLKLKGKGHEFSDAARLLSFYQEWLDDLFPKATFLDALAMVEKAGHKATVRNARLKWIDEGKPRAALADDDNDNGSILEEEGDGRARQSDRVAPVFEKAAAAAGQARARTPTAAGGGEDDDDDLFGDADLYTATPRRDGGGGGAAQPPGQVPDDAGVPDGDDLDALMAEAEAPRKKTAPAPVGSIFGDGSRSKGAQQSAGEPDEDELDVLMAMAEVEAEAGPQSGPTRPSQPAGGHQSIFGDGKPKEPAAQGNGGDRGSGDDDVAADDLDALMAEVDAAAGDGAAQSSAGSKAASAAQGEPSNPQTAPSFEEDEEAMAEMEGLW